MLPNTPNKNGQEQIDTSVTPATDLMPITNSPQNIQLLKNQMVNSNFEQQRAYQKQIFQMNAEIDQLRREVELARERLIDEKTHFEDLDLTVEDKHKQIMDANQLNQNLTAKIEELQKKNDDIENLYLAADSQRNKLAVRLKTVRTSLEQEVNNKGYTYIPPTHWTMSQERTPVCLVNKPSVAKPLLTNTGNYAEVFGEMNVNPTGWTTSTPTPTAKNNGE
jgi:septal ring factor EnvC (AmiA/AmiB activator)